MTALIALTAGLAIGALVAVPVTWRVTWHYYCVHGDNVTYDTKRDWRAIAAQADRDHRSAIRWQRTTAELRRIQADIVGHLLDKVADRDRALAQLHPTPPASVRRPPMPLYPRRRSTQ